MTIAFIWGSGVVVETSAKEHFSRSYTEEYCNRFFSIADKALFFTRIKKNDETDGLTNMDNMNIEYYECVNPMSIRGILSHKRNREKLNHVITKSDAVVINLPCLFVGREAEKICERYKVPYIVQLGGCPWDVMINHGIIGKLCALPAMIANKKDVRRAPAVVYVTKFFLQKRYPTNGKSVVCSNVALLKTDESVLKKRINKIKSKGSGLVIGTAAAVDVRYKGQQYVIKALYELKKRGDDRYEYQIAGGGDQSYLREIVNKYGLSDSVRFLGSLKHDEIFEWMDSIDLYIQPSRTEGLPRALIEAMSRGLPSLGACSGGIPELLPKECLFSNRQKEAGEISCMISRLTQDMMCEMAIRNFEYSKQYEADRLREIRGAFFKDNLCRE